MKNGKRWLALLLSALLITGSVTGPVFASEMDAESGTAETGAAMEESTEETIQDDDAYMDESAGEDASDGTQTEEDGAAVGDEETLQEDAGPAEACEVILDANGGYFTGEWDDVLGEYVESTQTLHRIIPRGGTITSFPVYEAEGVTAAFLGWSPDPDGEPVSQEYEEYAPVEDCVLYAVWYIEEAVEGSAAEDDTETQGDLREDLQEDLQEAAETEAAAGEGTEDAAPEDASAEDNIPEEGAFDDASSEDASAEDNIPEEGAFDDASSEDESAETAAPEEAASEDAAPEDGNTEDAAPESETLSEEESAVTSDSAEYEDSADASASDGQEIPADGEMDEEMDADAASEDAADGEMDEEMDADAASNASEDDASGSGTAADVFEEVSVDEQDSVEADAAAQGDGNSPVLNDTDPADDTADSDTAADDALQNGQSIASCEVQISGSSFTYNGTSITPSVTVKNGSTTLVKDTDYTVSYQNNTNAGTAKVIVNGQGGYYGTVEKTFTISPASIANASVTGLSAKTYTGSAITQTPVVKSGSTTLNADTDYTVAYSNNTNAGTATVTITGKGNYTGTKTATFTINKAAQTITAKAAAASVSAGRTVTVSTTGAQGKVTYKSSNNSLATVNAASGVVTAKKVGTVKITATAAATANYNAASQTVTIKVVPAATKSLKAENQATGIRLTWRKVTGATGYKVYRGSTLVKTIKSGTTLTYTDKEADTNGTKYVFKIVATASTGTSTLSKSVTTYRLAAPSLKTSTNTSYGEMTAAWEKNAKGNGYQLQYSTSSSFGSGNKAATIKKTGTLSRVITGLKAGKTYYVRIRAYKKVGSARYNSAWSAKKAVKISGSTIPVRQTDTAKASSGCSLKAVRGIFYKESASKILKRINAIRYEACKEGVTNPDTGKKLRLSDYKPIKWSSDLEWIAQTRAAEAAVFHDHMRPNGGWCFDCTSNGEQSWAEDLAWNWSGTMKGIEQWYEEKEDWVNQTGGVTGHYTSMISPSYNYIALGCFRLSSGGWYSVSAEFSFMEGLDTASTGVSGVFDQMIEMSSAYSDSFESYQKEPIDISIAKVTNIKDKKYTGKHITQDPVVKIGGTTLKKGTDYTLSYKNNKNKGKATIIIKGKGQYTGTISRNFRITK